MNIWRKKNGSRPGQPWRRAFFLTSSVSFCCFPFARFAHGTGLTGRTRFVGGGGGQNPFRSGFPVAYPPRAWLAPKRFPRNFPIGPGFTQVLLGFTRFYRVLPGFTGFYRVSLSFTGFELACSRFYWVLLDFTKLYRVLPGFTGFLSGFTRFCRAWTGLH